MQEPLLIGWREWVGLPQLGLAAIKAKIDTGARSSSLHVDALETFDRDGRPWLRFTVTPRRRRARAVECEAPAVERRPVTDSGGRTAERWFIRSPIVLGGIRFDADINLTDRGGMLFPMLLGRTALCGRFRVDPGQSWVCGRRNRRSAVA
ncbi:MAG: ATP-dependent zinc protease [Proteobacteria bacterium]|nr:ATP-dependent zinc protease [Pseudomonadota bacterium]